MQLKEKRYAVTVDLYIYANSDAEAKESATKVEEYLNINEDAKAEVLTIHETPFGQIGKARETC